MRVAAPHRCGAVLLTATAVAVVAASLVAPTSAQAADQPKPKPQSAAAAKGFTSIFPKEPFKGSGWAACASPIVWHADVHTLSPDVTPTALDDLRTAFGTWSAASGIAFIHGDDMPLAYDDLSSTVKPTTGPALPRHIYVMMVPDERSTYMSNRVVGVASPTHVIVENREIIGGSAAFRSDYMEYANQSESVALLLHEIGHALGLGHVDVSANVMYPLVTRTSKLGVGDTIGMKTFTRPCDHVFDTQRGIG